MTNKRSIQNEMDGLDLKIDHLGPIETASRGIDKIPATAKKLSKPLGAIALGTALALGSVAPAHGQNPGTLRGVQRVIDDSNRVILRLHGQELQVQAIIYARETPGFTQLSESEQIRVINQAFFDAAFEKLKDFLAGRWSLLQFEFYTGNAQVGNRFVGDLVMDIRVISYTRIIESEQETQQGR